MGSTISTGINHVEDIFNKKYKKHVDKNSIVGYYMQVAHDSGQQRGKPRRCSLKTEQCSKHESLFHTKDDSSQMCESR